MEQPSYIIHSKKGTEWKTHKYIKKVNGKYVYSTNKISKTSLDTMASDTMAGKYGKGSDMQKALGENYGAVASTISKKFKKSSNSKSSSSKSSSSTNSSSKSSSSANSSNKTSTSKSSIDKSNTENTIKNSTSNSVKTIKSVLTDSLKIGDNDSFVATQNTDGSYEIKVTYEDGSVQTVDLNASGEIINKGERTKKTVEHSDFNGPVFWSPDDGFYHHGILGQHWGKKNAPPYPIPDGDHSAAEKKANKYRNIDGSLTEKGIDHKAKYVMRQTKKNNKKYQHYIDKYEKKANKANEKGDTETKEYYLNRKKNAESTRDSVNEYFKKMGIDDIAEQEQMYKEKALKTAGIVAGTAAATALGIGAPMLITKGAKAAATFLQTVDPAATVESLYAMADTPAGKKAVDAIDTGIRAYSDVRAYAFSIYADQTINRLNESGVVSKAGKLTSDVLGSSGNAAKAAIAVNAVNSINSSGKAAVNAGNNALNQEAAQASVNEILALYNASQKIV